MSSPNSARRSSSRSTAGSKDRVSPQAANEDVSGNVVEAEFSPLQERRASLRSSSKGSVEEPEKKGGNEAQEEEGGAEQNSGKPGKKSSLADKFHAWPNKDPHPPGEPQVPDLEQHWGWIITSPGKGEKAHDFSKQPAARLSDGQTEPPLWENREFAWKKGNRHTDINGVRVDQEDHLVLRLIDMSKEKIKKESDSKEKVRKKRGKKGKGKGSDGEEEDLNPKRLPRHCAFHGKPKDWNDSHAITKMNQSRKDYIKRLCCDKIWTNLEAEFIADQFKENPDISIMELTCSLNDRFLGKQYIADPQEWDNPSVGRTIECVRAEYLTYKDQYDKGEAPHKKQERDKNEVVASTGQTVGEMIDSVKETVDIPDGPSGMPNYTGSSLTIAKLLLHASQREPPVSMKKLGKKTKDNIIDRLEAADKYGVDDNGLPNIPGSEKPGPGSLSVAVVNTVFELGQNPEKAAYNIPIQRLQREKVQATKKGQKKAAAELQGLIGSLFAAQDAAEDEARTSASRKRTRSRSNSNTADSPSKRRKNSAPSQQSSQSKSSTNSAGSRPRSRTPSRVKINEQANQIIEPSGDESDTVEPPKTVSPRRKSSGASPRRVSSSPRSSTNSRPSSTRSRRSNSNDEAVLIVEEIDESPEEAAEQNYGNTDSEVDDADDGLDISD